MKKKSYFWIFGIISIYIKPEIYKNYFEKGIIVLYDLLDSQGRFMDYDTFSTKYNTRSNMTSDVTNTVKNFFKPVLGDWQSYYRQCRNDEVILFRACISHTYLTHSYILK